MTPHHLHALAAAHSLDDARRHLAHLADAEAAQIAAEALEAPSVLRSPVWGRGCGSGSYSDPTPRTAAVADRPERRNRWQEMLDRLDHRIAGIARMFADSDGPPLDRLRANLPAMMAGRAYWLRRHLADEDRWVREAIGVAALRVPVLGVDCPACRHRSLHVQAEGPRDVWTVVCDGRWDNNVHNPCLCAGAGCPCGMEATVEGVAHIWLRSDVLSTAGGAR